MSFCKTALSAFLAAGLPFAALAQSSGDAPAGLSLELNALQETGGACRLTFVAQNGTGSTIDQAVFETVIFDQSGGVVSLSLFDFRELPAGRPRVRQFDLPGMTCDGVGQVLINGASSCIVNGEKSGICHDALTLRSRLSVGLVG